MRDILKRAAAAGERHLSQRSIQLRRLGQPFGVGTEGDERPMVAWSEWLIFFFRVMAIFQLAKGLVHWAFLIGDVDPAVRMTPRLTEIHAGNIYFGVLDLVAGVGLWLTSSWGAVLWLLAAMSQIAVCLGFPEVYGTRPFLILFEIAAVATYLFLTWKVANSAEEK